MSEWKEYKLGDLIEYKKGFAFQSSTYQRKGTLVVRISDTTDNSINISSCHCVNDEIAKRCKDYRLFENDIVIATVGSWADNPNSIVGKVIRVPKSAHNALLNQNAVRLRSNDNINSDMLYYKLKDRAFSDYLLNTAQGSANQASITLKDIFEYNILLPSIKEQEQLAGVLSSLDDKIDLLTRQNRTLEAMAETLFRQYFIENPKEDWKDGKLSDICCLRNKKQSIAETTLAQYISTENMLSDKMGIVEATSLPTNGNGTVYYLGDILVSNIRPYFKKIWLADKDGICSNDVLCFTSHCDEIHNSYIYYILRQNDFFEYVMLGSKGCKMPRGDKDHIKNYPIYIPDRETLHNFHHFIEPNITKIQNNQAQIRSLTKLRDTLLPKLMNNEIKI